MWKELLAGSPADAQHKAAALRSLEVLLREVPRDQLKEQRRRRQGGDSATPVLSEREQGDEATGSDGPLKGGSTEEEGRSEEDEERLQRPVGADGSRASGRSFEELRAREGELFEGLLEVAFEPGGSAGAAGRCFYLYGLRCDAFPQVWRCVLRKMSATLPFPRLRSQLRLVRGVLDAEKAEVPPFVPRAAPGLSPATSDSDAPASNGRALSSPGASTGRALAGGLAVQVLGALLQILEDTRRHELLPEIVPALSAGALCAPQEFSSSFFQDSVDLLLGWAVDAALSDERRVVINTAFASFQAQWQDPQHLSFALSLQRKLLTDMQKLATGMVGRTPREETSLLHALLHCFYGISVPMGNFGEQYGSVAPLLLCCIRLYSLRLSAAGSFTGSAEDKDDGRGEERAEKEEKDAAGDRDADAKQGEGLSAVNAAHRIRLCVYAHLACLEAAGPSVQSAAALQVLGSAAFRRLRLLLDPGLRRLAASTYQVLLTRCGLAIRDLTLQALRQEIQQLLPDLVPGCEGRQDDEEAIVLLKLKALSGSEVASLAIFDLALLRNCPEGRHMLRAALDRPEVLWHATQGPPGMTVAVAKGSRRPVEVPAGRAARFRSLLLACIWESAGQDIDEEGYVQGSLDDLGSQLRSALAGGAASSAGRILLRALHRAGAAVFWQCLGQDTRRELLQLLFAAAAPSCASSTGRCADMAPALETVLALCPLQGGQSEPKHDSEFLVALAPHVADLLDVTAVGLPGSEASAGAARRCAVARARLLSIAGRLGQGASSLLLAADKSTSLAAAHLRGLLPTTPPLSGHALVSLLSALRTLNSSSEEGAADPRLRMLLPALFWASPAAPLPQEVPGNCRTLWLLLQAADFFVGHRLKSPFGSASSSLQLLETLILDSSATVAREVCEFLRASSKASTSEEPLSVRAATRFQGLCDCSFGPLACVQLVFMLEQLILLSQEPVHMQPAVATRQQLQQHSKMAHQFFDANRRVCGDWFQRMRGVLRQTLGRYGSQHSHCAVSLTRLAEVLRQILPLTDQAPLSQQALVAWTLQSSRSSRSSGSVAPVAAQCIEQNLVPLLSSALAMRNVGLVRGLFAVHGHAAWALDGEVASNSQSFQEPFLAFAAQRYEESAALFASRTPATEAATGTAVTGGSPAQAADVGPGRSLQSLVARTWLEAAIEARHCSSVKRWHQVYEESARVSPATKAYARAYLQLLAEDWVACKAAISETKAAAVADWGAAADMSLERMNEGVCRLSRWGDLEGIFVVEATMALKQESVFQERSKEASWLGRCQQQALQALVSARYCLEADIAARCHTEPCALLPSSDACEPHSSELELLELLASAASGERRPNVCVAALGSASLQRVATLDLLPSLRALGVPITGRDHPRCLELVRQQVRLRNFNLADSILTSTGLGMDDSELIRHNAMILEGQRDNSSAFSLLSDKLSEVLELKLAGKVQRASLALALAPGGETTEALLFAQFLGLLSRRGRSLLSSRAAADSAHSQQLQGLRSCLEQLGRSCQAASRSVSQDRGAGQGQGGGGLFAAASVQRWRSAMLLADTAQNHAEARTIPSVLLPDGSIAAARKRVNPHFLGMMSLQGALLHETSPKLWANYADWLFAQQLTLDGAYIEHVLARALPSDAELGAGPAGASPEDFQQLCRGSRRAVRRWMRRRCNNNNNRNTTMGGEKGSSDEALSIQWLQRHSKLPRCRLWKKLSVAGQQRVALALSSLCNWLAEWRPQAVEEAARSYVQHLSVEQAPFSAHPRVQRCLLRILRLLAQHQRHQQCRPQAEAEPPEALADLPEPLHLCLSRLPTHLWEPLVPQLLAYMNHLPTSQNPGIGPVAAGIFAAVAKSAPHQAIFPALAAQAPIPDVSDSSLDAQQQQQQQQQQEQVGGSSQPGGSATSTPIKLVQDLHPELLLKAEIFAHALNAMANPVDEVCTRLLQYAETFLASKPRAEVVDAVSLVLGHFSLLVQALDSATGEHCAGMLVPGGARPGGSGGTGAPLDVLGLMGVLPNLSTAYSRRFLTAFLPPLRRLLFLHKPYLARLHLPPAGVSELHRSMLAHLRLLLRTCSHFSKLTSVPLQELAPELVEMFLAESRGGGSKPVDGRNFNNQVVLPVEIQVQDSSLSASKGMPLLQVCRVGQRVHLLSTKTKPKKLDFEAQDGSLHTFLLKGRDDLRLDSRIMQLLQAVNGVIATEDSATLFRVCGPSVATTAAAGPLVPLRLRDYDVVPIAPRAGLIRWVSAVPLFVLHRQRRQALQDQQLERATGCGAGSEDATASTATGTSAAAAAKQQLVLESSADVWHRKVQKHLKSMDVDMEATPRKNWPLEALRRTFAEMQADSPADLISRELLLSSLHPGQHFARCTAYTQSVALTSVIGHLIGLGDRHLDNLLLDLVTGEVVHVDYSICFDRGQRLRVPERVPFRLTRCMVAALGPLGLGGLFVQTMEAGLGLLQEWRELMLALAEPCFLLAPINDWVQPVATPFRQAQATGSLIRKLCEGLREANLQAADAASDALRAIEHMQQFVAQHDSVREAQKQHSHLKENMSQEYAAMLEAEKQRVRTLEDLQSVDQQLAVLDSEETVALSTLQAADTDSFVLQDWAVNLAPAALDQRRMATQLLLATDSEQGLALRGAASTYPGLLPLEAFQQRAGSAGSAPLARTAATAARALGQLQQVLANLSAQSSGLPYAASDVVSWCLLRQAPDKLRLDELCSVGFVTAAAVWWLPPGSLGAKAEVDEGLELESRAQAVLGMQAQGSLALGQEGSAQCSEEALGTQVLGLLRAEAELAVHVDHLATLTAADGELGAVRLQELAAVHLEAGQALQQEAQRSLRPQGPAAVTGRPTGLQRRRLSALLLAALHETAVVVETASSLRWRKTSGGELAALFSQGIDFSGPETCQTSLPQHRQLQQEQLLALPAHCQLLALSSRISQVVDGLLHANVLDYGHKLTALAQHWQELAEGLVEVEAAYMATTAVRAKQVDLLQLLGSNAEAAGVGPTDFESQWRLPESSSEVGGPKTGDQKQLSAEVLSRQLDSCQSKLRSFWHPGCLPGHGLGTDQSRPSMLGLPGAPRSSNLQGCFLELKRAEEQLSFELARLKGLPEGPARQTMAKTLSESIAALRSSCEAAAGGVDLLLHSDTERPSLTLARAFTRVGQELGATSELLQEVVKSFRVARQQYRQQQILQKQKEKTGSSRMGWRSPDEDVDSAAASEASELQFGSEGDESSFYNPGALPAQLREALRGSAARFVAPPTSQSLASNGATGSLPPGLATNGGGSLPTNGGVLRQNGGLLLTPPPSLPPPPPPPPTPTPIGAAPIADEPRSATFGSVPPGFETTGNVVGSPVDGGSTGRAASAADGTLQLEVELAFIRTEVELLLGAVSNLDTPILVASGLELAGLASETCLPGLTQLASYLFSFLLEQLHSLDDLSEVLPTDQSPSGVLAAVSELGIDTCNVEDLSKLCRRRAENTGLLRSYQLTQGAAFGFRAMEMQVVPPWQLPALRESLCRAPPQNVAKQMTPQQEHRELMLLLELEGMKTRLWPEYSKVLGSQLTNVDREAHPALVLCKLLEAREQHLVGIAGQGPVGGAASASSARSREWLRSEAGSLSLFLGDAVSLFMPNRNPVIVGAKSTFSSCAKLPKWLGNVSSAAMAQEMFRGGGGNQGMLAYTLEQMSAQGEQLEQCRSRAQQELTAFLERHQALYSAALGLAQPALGASAEVGAEAVRAAATALVGPLLLFQKLLAGQKAPRKIVDPDLDLTMAITPEVSVAITPGTVKDLRALPSAITSLVRLCEAASRRADGRAQGLQLLMQLQGFGGLPAPPAVPPPPPPPLPAVKEQPLEDGGDPTTGAGSSSQPTSQDESSGNEEEEEEGRDQEDDDDDEEDDEEARTMSAEAGYEERLLAQDKEEVDDQMASPLTRPQGRDRSGQNRAATTGREGVRKDEDEEDYEVDREGEGEEDEEKDETSDEEDDEASDEDDESPTGQQADGGKEVHESSKPTVCPHAAYAVRSISRKIPRAGARLDLEAEALISAAINPDDLAQMYEGWTAWI
ncbi:unnamed protein product [Polarella glacialis]|uniref:non-specific serine/threonine protein kinase n=1 Tax=Polarella glacialis TaxID=89957 RepID=A0A813G4H1_POLGL|nr:unnamed protein product [Polarella glacialis]